MLNLDRLRAEVEEYRSVGEGAIALLSRLAAELRVHANNPQGIEDLADRLDAQNGQLAAAVEANTPAVVPEPEPAEPETEEPEQPTTPGPYPETPEIPFGPTLIDNNPNDPIVPETETETETDTNIEPGPDVDSGLDEQVSDDVPDESLFESPFEPHPEVKDGESSTSTQTV